VFYQRNKSSSPQERVLNIPFNCTFDHTTSTALHQCQELTLSDWGNVFPVSIKFLEVRTNTSFSLSKIQSFHILTIVDFITQPH
jgi:hypothetical protein